MLAHMNRPASLLRILGLAFGLAIVVGNTIGGGILRTPGDIAGLLPNPWTFVGIWLVGALYALLGANALAELGTMMPRSAGLYHFARRAFGDYAGFLVGWGDWMSTCASTAAIAIVLGESAASLLSLSADSASRIAIGVVVVFTVMLVRGTRLGDFAQRATSAIKAIALLVLVGVCFIFAGGAREPVSPASAVSAVAATSGFAAFMLAAQAVIYTYDGWSGPLYFAEELDDPARQIPRSMFYGLLSVAVIYLLINVAFIYAVPTTVLAGSPLAAATVAERLFGARGDLFVRLVVVASMPSAINACLLMASRVLYSMGRDRLGPAAATRVNAGGTPSVSLLASGAVAVGFLATGTFNSLIAIAAFFFVADYALCFVALFVFRRRDPEASRPYRAVWHPWTTGFVLAGSITFLVSAVISDRRNSLYALGIVIVSYPVFRFSRGKTVPAPSVDPYLSN
jgi:basic amino acid/polyamine antiporter, APA family